MHVRALLVLRLHARTLGWPQGRGPERVNSEAWEHTPPEELRRMLESDGRARSPYL